MVRVCVTKTMIKVGSTLTKNLILTNCNMERNYSCFTYDTSEGTAVHSL